MTYKLTIDGNLSDQNLKGPALDTLLRWKEEGKVELDETNPTKTAKPAAYGWPGAAPKTDAEKAASGEAHRGRPRKMAESGNANFKTVAASVYPGKDPHKLNMVEINNVAHLIKHHSARNEIFVTTNVRDLIEGGRRAILKAQFGIIVMTPDEAVSMLNELQGWERPQKAEKAPKAEKPEKAEKVEKAEKKKR